MRLVQVAVGVQDLDRAVAFYQDVVGLEHKATYDPPGLAFFDLAGIRLLLDRGAPGSLVYLGVDDLPATIARLRERGVTVETEAHVIFTHEDDTLGPSGTAEWMAFVRDSEQNLLGLVEQRPG
jgi:methylmalonyl-CoA/ethylmalonyl-CoA epimerase